MLSGQEIVELAEAQYELWVFLVATQCLTEEQASKLVDDYDTPEKCDKAVNEICDTFQLSFAFMNDDWDEEAEIWS